MESSYKIIENKDGSDHVMDEILDLSTKSSSDYHEEIDARVAELNYRQCEFSSMDTSVNSQSDLDNKADDGTPNSEITPLPENSSGFEVDTCHEDQSVDGANIPDESFMPESSSDSQTDEHNEDLTTVVVESDYDGKEEGKDCSLDFSTASKLRNLSFDVKLPVPKKFLPDLKIKNLVDYDLSIDSSTHDKNSEKVKSIDLNEMGNMEKGEVSVNSPELLPDNTDVNEKSVAVSANFVPLSPEVVVIEKNQQVSANVVTKEYAKSPEVTATEESTNVNENDPQEVPVKDGLSAKNDEDINYSQLLFDDEVEVAKTDEDKSVIEKRNSDDTSLVTNVDGIKDENGKSTSIIDVKSVTPDLEAKKLKNDEQDDLSPAIVLKLLHSEDVIQEVKDSVNDISLTSISTNQDNSTDSSFSKF